MSDDEANRLERDAIDGKRLDKEEITLLREIMRVYRGWQFMLKTAKGGTVILGIIAGAIIAWSTIGEAIKTWVS